MTDDRKMPRTQLPAFREANETSGRPGENRIALVFYHAGWMVQGYGSGPSHDLVLSHAGATFWVEVKNEDKNADTGNICVECYQRATRIFSGIYTSESQIWIHTLADMAVVYRAQNMRNFLETWRLSHNPGEYGDNKNLSYLVPIGCVQREAWCDRCRVDDLPNSPVFREVNAPPAWDG